MSVETIICEWIYGAFRIVKATLDTLVELYEVAVEKLYSIATTTNNVIFGVVMKGTEAILIAVTTTLNSIIAAMNQSIGAPWGFCANAYRCKFLLEQVLDPNSLIATTIRKILESTDDCYCKRQDEAVRDFQQTLYDIAYDYENFKTQICNGLSLDFANDMLIDLATSYLGKLNKWRRKIELIIRKYRKKLLSLLDTYRTSGVYDLLRQLEAFFDCVIDSELCANVDTAKSYYKYVTAKLKIRKVRSDKEGRTDLERAYDYVISPEFEDQIVGYGNTALKYTKKGIKWVQDLLDLCSSSYSTRGASNALDLTTSIVGIAKAVYKSDENMIPLVDYTSKKISDIKDEWDRYNCKNTDDPGLALSSNKCATYDDVLRESKATGDYTECLVVKPGTDTSHAQELLQIDDKFYTVAEAARQLYTGTGDVTLMNYCKKVGNMLDVKNVLTRY